jgi:hypothetical protein
MKNKTILLFIFCWHCAYCQQTSFLSKIYFSAEIVPPQYRWFDHKITKHSPHSFNNFLRPISDNWDEIYLGIGAKINKKMTLEVGYYPLDYWDGVDVQNTSCEYGGGGMSGNVEVADHYYLKFNFSPFQFKLLNRPMKFYCGIGYTYARQSGNNTLSGTDGFVLPCRDDKDTARFFVRTIEYKADLAKDFHLIDASIRLDYEFSKYMSLTGAIGFNQGFETLGRSKFKYYTTGRPTYEVESMTKGSNIYCSIGLRLSPFVDVEKRTKKKRSKKTKTQKRYVD